MLVATGNSLKHGPFVCTSAALRPIKAITMTTLTVSLRTGSAVRYPFSAHNTCLLRDLLEIVLKKDDELQCNAIHGLSLLPHRTVHPMTVSLLSWLCCRTLRRVMYCITACSDDATLGTCSKLITTAIELHFNIIEASAHAMLQMSAYEYKHQVSYTSTDNYESSSSLGLKSSTLTSRCP